MLLIPSQSLQASWWASTLFLGYTILKHHYSCRIGQINLKQWLRLQFCGMGFLQRVFGMVIPGNMVNLPTGLTSDCSRSKVSYYREAVSRWLYFLPARRGYQGQEGSFQLCFFLFFFFSKCNSTQLNSSAVKERVLPCFRACCITTPAHEG